MSDHYYGDPHTHGTPSLKSLRAVHENRIQSYKNLQTEARLAGYRARKEGDTVVYEAAVKRIRMYDDIIDREKEALRRLG